MAFGRLEQSRAPQPMSDINMTPLIDVMLVLMVIFMVTAPLLSTSLKLDLPKVDAPVSDPDPQALLLGIDAQGQLFLNKQAVSLEQLTLRVGTLAQSHPQTEVQLSSDENVKYARVAQVIAMLQQQGLTHIDLITAIGTNAHAATNPALHPPAR